MFENLNLTLTLAQATTGDAPPGPLPDAPPANTGDTGGGGDTATSQDTTNTTQKKTDDTTTDNPPASPFEGLMGMLPFLLIIVVFWFLIFGGQRKEKKKKAQMLQALGKNDRVYTIGGIIGTVVEVKDNEVVLKVDESSNTRMRFNRNAIQGVVSEETGK